VSNLILLKSDNPLDEYIEIPPEKLTAELLQAIIEDFITREGTEYGHEEYSLEDKVSQVERQLRDGAVFIAFDPATESCTLLARNY
jgi:uncharacterized protein YheU (UPF0270 family)